MYLFLSKPSIVYKKQYIEMVKEWKKAEKTLTPWVLNLSHENFNALVLGLENLSRGINLIDGQVSASTFWLVRSDGAIVGCANIRHKLNTNLSEYGGHIGYGIAPKYRKRGYGKHILALSLKEAKKLNISKVRITCDDDNIASEKIILQNKGIFDSKAVVDGKIIKRFWITQN